MVVDLRFVKPLNTSHPVDLVFGASGASSDVAIEIRATVPAPTMAATLARVRIVSLSATVPAPTMTAVLTYDNAVFRGAVSGVVSAWQDGARQHVTTRNMSQDGGPAPAYIGQSWQDAQRTSAATTVALQAGVPVSRNTPMSWSDAQCIGIAALVWFDDMERVRIDRGVLWHVAAQIAIDRSSSWQDRFRRPRPMLLTAWQQAMRAGIDRTTSAGAGKPIQHARRTTWQEARKPPPGRYSRPTIPVPPPGCYVPPAGGAVHLLFDSAFSGNTNLLFVCAVPRTQTIIIPVRGSYMVLNSVNLVRVDGNIALPHFALSLSIDMDSWTWSFTASLPASTKPLLMPAGPGDPVILEAEINGTSFVLQVEDINPDRTFGKSSISVSGRGRSAVLSDPYSPILTFGNVEARTAQQLANDALTTGGVSIGWAVDWRIDDWLVPAGVWRHQGTYMSAVNAIAAAAGAFIQPDPVAQTLRVRPRYPALPWDWATTTPDVEIPSDVISKEGIAYRSRPSYNFVIVSGTTAGGILGRVKRAGTAGDIAATMVTDALITAPAAARQRGGSVLADTGWGAMYSLGMPVLPETGILVPGTLIRYVDASIPTIGLVKGVGVNCTSSDNGKVTVKQTLELETHA